eukprot:6542906-Pyramimonas_sp.AAC.1
MTLWANVETTKGIETLLAETMWRTAHIAIKNWTHLHDELHEAAMMELPTRAVIEGRWSAPCWQGPTSIVQRLKGSLSSTFFAEGKGSTFKRIARELGNESRARTTLHEAHRRAARQGLLAAQLAHLPRRQAAHTERTWVSNVHGRRGLWLAGRDDDDALRWRKRAPQK